MPHQPKPWGQRGLNRFLSNIWVTTFGCFGLNELSRHIPLRDAFESIILSGKLPNTSFAGFSSIIMKILSSILALLVLLTTPLSGATDISELTKETQRTKQEPGKFTMVWWIPTQFWEANLKNDPRLTDTQKTDLSKILDKYTVVVVVAGDFGPMAAYQSKKHDDIVANTELRVNDKVIPLLQPADVSKSAINFISVMKPLMANMLGAMGEGMEFLLYSNDQNGTKLIDGMKSGGFTYTVFGNKFTWRLPLGSLLPRKIDPSTQEEFPGNYLFNPFTGGKLAIKPDAVKN